MLCGCNQYLARWFAKPFTYFFSNIKKKNTGSKKSKRTEDSGADWDDSDDEDEFSDLDDEEVSLGSMDEEDFEKDMDEEGGVFMDVSDDDDNLGKVTFNTKKKKKKFLKVHYLICNYMLKFNYLGGRFGF